MGIKTRLILSFGSLVLIIFIRGAVTSYMSLKLSELLGESIVHSRTLSFWRETDFALSRQNRTIDYFLLFRTTAERESFNTQSALINRKLKVFLEKEDVAAGNYSRDKISTWQKNYSEYIAIVNRLFGVRGSLFGYFERNIEPTQKNLSATISSNIGSYEERIDRIEKEIGNLSRTSIVFSVLSGILAFGVAIFLSISLFRSISEPIHTLEKGAKIIGGGYLDHRIVLNNAPPEIMTLANNFNAMVESLGKLQLQILQMDRMSSIGQLSGGVAHEINNPLTGVLGQSQLLLEKLPEDSPYRMHVQKIESAAQRCRKIVRSLLDFSRDKDYQFSKVRLEKILDETLDLLSTELQSKNIELKKEISGTMPEVVASASHMHQVFLNIITNSIQSIGKNGSITIRCFADGNYGAVAIKDTGIGIKREYLNHVFDPFFSTKEVGKGTGLGLTICYGIIKQHRGEISARSEGENKGAEVTVRVPVR